MLCKLIFFPKNLLFKSSQEVFVPTKHYFFIFMRCESISFEKNLFTKNSMETLVLIKPIFLMGCE